jgi:hypothetical protein
MTTAENSLLYFENGQSLVPMVALTDSGDHKAYNSAAEIWSDEAGFSPVIKPDGVLTGLVVTPAATGANDKVDLSAGTLNLAGIVTTLTASADITCLRGATVNICRINSITITSAGAVSVVSGTAHTAFSEVRGADGGPSFIPAGSVEIAQVRFPATTAAPVAGSQIMAVPNRHRETANYPSIIRINPIREQDTILGAPGVDFSTALMRNHTGSVTKKVYAQYYEPDFAEVLNATDFQPAIISLTTSSQPVYGGAIGEVSSALKNGKFKTFLENGISDAILRKEGKKIWFKYYADRLRTENYILTQGYLGITPNYPARSSITADCTINAIDPGKRITG